MQKLDELGRNAFPFRQDDFGEDIHKIIQELFMLSNAAFTTISHSFRHGGAPRGYKLKRLLLPKLKDRRPWENGSTLYKYIQGAKSFIVLVRVTDEAKKFLKLSKTTLVGTLPCPRSL